MGGSSVDEWVIASPSGDPRTVVLVGCTGNGKSATGNSILQKEAFVSKAKSSGVTQTCELRTTVLKDGQTLNVIDTPGIVSFYLSNRIFKFFSTSTNRNYVIFSRE